LVSYSLTECAKGEKLVLLDEVRAKEMLRSAGIPVNDTKLASSREEAITLSQQLGFPVALKIVSPDVVHKSDCGGVKLNLESAEQVGGAYDDILSGVHEKCPNAAIGGVSVQSMAHPGIEVIIGVSQDKQFGPVIMFGLGGILVEVLKDVSFRVIPLTAYDAAEIVREIKGYPLLRGFRGHKPVDVSCLEEFLLKVSRFMEDNDQVMEIDLNPVFAYPEGAVAVDARIVLKNNHSAESL